VADIPVEYTLLQRRKIHLWQAHDLMSNNLIYHLAWNTLIKWSILGFAAISFGAAAETDSPYGKAVEDHLTYPLINTVFDVYCQSPEQFSDIFSDLQAVITTLKGRVVVVARGAEIAVFARKHYESYRVTVDHLARMARGGVQFRLDRAGMQAAGFEAEDMHGFVTIIPSGLSEIASLQDGGSRYLRFSPRQRSVNLEQGAPGVSEKEQADQEPRFKFSW